ncbi:MAG: cell wall metabolism sensor histidine kinase WalK [Chloroflexota bacterium]|nr:cell wall metabolism sensor histidine kinase WalK [Chloroflexota bacterium]
MAAIAWIIAICALTGGAAACWSAVHLRSRLHALEDALRQFLPEGDAGSAVRRMRAVVGETRQRAAEVAAENGRLRTILAALDDAVIVVGHGQEILSVNDAALVLFPTSLATVRGRTVIEMTGDHEIADLVQRCQSAREPQERLVEVSASGRVVRVIAVPADDTHDDVLLLARDVTQVHHLQTVRRELVANVSHELRTPLASIKLYVETLLDGGLEVPGMAEDRLNKINREVDELTQLVRELLELARLESGRDQPNFAALDVAELARNAVERLEAQADRADVALETAIPSGVPAVWGDRRMLEGALVNLVHNAVKFTPAGGRVTVGADSDSDTRVRLWVEDTGVGIPDEHLPRLFERFYKEDPARSGGGTGLGLAIVKHVALVHGGAVSVTSAVGRGSRFMITLAVSESEMVRASRPSTSIVPSVNNSLIVPL